MRALVGLGGNLGGEAAVLARFAAAARAIAAWPETTHVARSSTWRTSPVAARGATAALAGQPDFLNAALRVDTRAEDPVAFLAALLALEAQLGRVRGAGEARGGPRAIDLDLLLWGDEVRRAAGPPALEVPHPRLAERLFALAPAVELLGPDARVPGGAGAGGAGGAGGARLGDLLARARGDAAQRADRL